ncbi:FK506-binding protein 4 [Durio zibethinus]|uniref:FK506-binding protein 4 n=1 Tax=Durio zibethinus TaxID=66656 RepID=A0A6P6BCS0_DURZI|nr:FK506-binding protein 4 [Durio zibethinus]
MGGCATKPKALKDDEGEVPVPDPEPTKEPVPAVPEAKEAADVATEGEKKAEADVVNEIVKAKEVVNDDKVDDQANKRQSLSNLFKENEKKGSAESDNTPSEQTKSESLESVKQESLEPVKIESLAPVQIKSVEPVKQEPEKQAPSDTTDKLKEAYVTMDQETKEPEKPTEQTYKPEPVSVAPRKIESVQSIEAKPAPEAAAAAAVNVLETKNKETSADDKKGKKEVAK